MILHLFFIFNLGLDALPISSNTSNIDNSKINLPEKVIRSKNRANKFSADVNISSIIANIQVPEDFNLTQVAQDLKDFGIHHLKDDKHIEGLPLDRHGQINPDFHKEIFLGNHELFESHIRSDVQKRNKKLEEIFNDADQNRDGRLSHNELLDHIFQNVQKHSNEAKVRNSQLFILIDTDQNGKITWHEYAALYIKFHHMNESDIKDLNDIDFIEESVDEDLQREIIKIRVRWAEADTESDYELNFDEFLAFRHPEIVARSYQSMVDDIFSQLDQNGDLTLNENEFVYVPSQFQNGSMKEWSETDRRWIEQQKIEFHEMDENQDGALSRDELLRAYDPLNRAHFNIQVKRLFSIVDDNPKDDHLSLGEIQKHASEFADIQFLDAGGGLHEEM